MLAPHHLRRCWLWSNVAAMPPNGVALSGHHWLLPLPSSDAFASDVTWHALQVGRAEGPLDLVRPSLNHSFMGSQR